MHSQVARGSCYENTGHIALDLRQPENRCIVKRRPKITQLSFPGSSPSCYTSRETFFVYTFCPFSFHWKEKKPFCIVISNELHSFDCTGIACTKNASWAKRGERGILRKAQNEREARDDGEGKKWRVLLTWLVKRLLCRLTLDRFEPIALPSFYYIVKSQKFPVSEHGKCHDNDLVVSFISSVCKGQLQLKSRNVLSVAWVLEWRPCFESTLSTTDTSCIGLNCLREMTDL